MATQFAYVPSTFEGCTVTAPADHRGQYRVVVDYHDGGSVEVSYVATREEADDIKLSWYMQDDVTVTYDLVR